MQVSKKNRIGIVVVAAIILMFSGVSAAEPIFDVQAGIDAGWKSDSNFYKESTYPKEVWSYWVAPVVNVSKETARTEFNLDYGVYALYYRDQDSLAPGEVAADEKDYLGHQAEGKFLYKPVEMITLGLDYAFLDTLDPKVTDQLYNPTENDEFILFRFSPLADFQFGRDGRLSFNTKYRNTSLEYDNGAQEGSEEHRGIFALNYELTAAIEVGVDYQLAKIEYDKTSSDYMSNQVKLTSSYDTGIFVVEAGAGMNYRDFDDAGMDDDESFVYKLAFSMEGAESKISLESQYNFNTRSPGNGYYRAHRVGLDAELTYAERIPLGIMGYFQQMDYVDTKGLDNSGVAVDRVDNVYHLAGKVGYKITEWITFSVAAGYEDMQSNTVDNDYDNTFVMGTIELDLYPR